MPLYCPLDKRERGYGDAEYMSGQPTGTVTFLFTDIEGSTSLWERDAKRMQAALARHDGILQSAIEVNGGQVFKTVGDALRQYLGAPLLPGDRPRHERYLAAACSLLNEAAWEAAWEEGQAMTWEAAISYALEGAEE